MKIRMTVHVSGDRNGVPWPPMGSVLDVPDTEGAEYCAAGMAVPVAQFNRSEKAVAAPAEERADAERPSGLTKRTGPRGG